MKEERYLIKEAAALVGVESHVLRYWEEELKMDIHRNGMGHRYYTKKDIELLTKVRNLKEKGLQLKAIRNYLDMRREQIAKENTADSKGIESLSVEDEVSEDLQNVIMFAEKSKNIQDVHSDLGKTQEKPDDVEEIDKEAGSALEMTKANQNLVPVKQQILSNEAKMEQFQQLMNRIVSNAIQENNDLIGKSAGEHAANAVVNQISGMTKEQEERAEERYRKLDQTLREIQRARQEAAATHIRPVDKRRQARLNRKSKNAAQGKQETDSVESVSH